MAEGPKTTTKTFEHQTEATPRLVTETPAPDIQLETSEAPQVRTARVPKLDQKTVWRVIDMLKSL